ncbi:MAG: Hsp33 family molecular chaperone HslO [Eubacteriaceae bacterium]
MSDYLIKALAGNGQIRIFATTTKSMVETARTAHNTSPVVTKALGRLLTAGALMGSMMKNNDEILTLKITGSGPISGLLVTVDSKGNVKGYPYVHDLGDTIDAPVTVASAVGEGNLTIIKDFGLKEPYVGYSPLVSGEIAEDLTYYYAQSEQTPSSVSLGVLLEPDGTVKQAGGFIIQLLPNTEEHIIAALESALIEMPSMTKLLAEGKTIEEILKLIFVNLDLVITKSEIPRFFCNCTRDKVTKALIAIGIEDLKEMINAEEIIEMNCDFCNTKYPFTPKELSKILEILEAKNTSKREN